MDWTLVDCFFYLFLHCCLCLNLLPKLFLHKYAKEVTGRETSSLYYPGQGRLYHQCTVHHFPSCLGAIFTCSMLWFAGQRRQWCKNLLQRSCSHCWLGAPNTSGGVRDSLTHFWFRSWTEHFLAWTCVLVAARSKTYNLDFVRI